MTPISKSFARVALVAGVLMVSCGALVQDRAQARSMVISRQGIVATEHPLASQIGFR